MTGNPAAAHIRLDRVFLSFPLYHAGARSLKKTMLGAVGNAVGGRLGRVQGGRAKGKRIVVEALRDISLTIPSGERLGLIGGNGAGKTSLLRLLAGIYPPVSGTIQTRGKIQALLHPSQGMQPDLTGRENIQLGGLYHGLHGPALRRLADDVAGFAELGDFLDLPLRVYSAGMAVRLGFALATAMRPQILLMDEWFLAGDAAFMHKARGRLEDMVRGAEILVLATHQDTVLRDWCTRVLWLDQGRVRAQGTPEAIIHAYQRSSSDDVPTAEPEMTTRSTVG